LNFKSCKFILAEFEDFFKNTIMNLYMSTIWALKKNIETSTLQIFFFFFPWVQAFKSFIKEMSLRQKRSYEQKQKQGIFK